MWIYKRTRDRLVIYGESESLLTCCGRAERKLHLPSFFLSSSAGLYGDYEVVIVILACYMNYEVLFLFNYNRRFLSLKQFLSISFFLPLMSNLKAAFSLSYIH
ncbi:hypothetical protein BDA96_06G296900 [Sorghum bicolor]|uniref:Uncharacterized protein n=2 Tax=Sorghum bicolor TaxID=4558 RepID=A0A1B6PP71_SORBI|nr:hypothetical protein BDA96_06G296900 [Sorghum bicolor]KXG27472.1 hypothetical protein SORBI_3006G273100 [Sorghum bicolor]